MWREQEAAVHIVGIVGTVDGGVEVDASAAAAAAAAVAADMLAIVVGIAVYVLVAAGCDSFHTVGCEPCLLAPVSDPVSVVGVRQRAMTACMHLPVIVQMKPALVRIRELEPTQALVLKPTLMLMLMLADQMQSGTCVSLGQERQSELAAVLEFLVSSEVGAMMEALPQTGIYVFLSEPELGLR